MDHLIQTRKQGLVLINKKITCHLADFTITANHKMKIKESEKLNKYMDFSREHIKLLNMKVTLTSVVIGIFGTGSK